MQRRVGVVVLVALAVWAGDGVADVGFQTGTVHGTVKTNGGVVPPMARVEARSTVDGSQATAYVDDGTGEYLLTLPAGDYTLDAVYSSNVRIGTASISLAAGANNTQDFRFAGGFISAHVTRNGADDVYALMYLQSAETPPGCFAAGATCQGGGDFCFCNLDGKPYTCDPSGCRYLQRDFFQTSTDASGVARILAPAGLWDVSVSSSSPFGPDMQNGSVGVGSASGVVLADGADVLAVDVAYETAEIAGVVTANGAPLTGVVVSAQAPTGTIAVPVDASGAYTLVLPATATYSISAVQQGVTVIGAVDSVTPSPGTSTRLDFSIVGAELSGDVVRDGVPAPNAPVFIDLVPPSSCGVDECGPLPPPPDTPCQCVHDNMPYFCIPTGPGVMSCHWLGAGGRLSTYTDGNGHFSKFLAPGTYDVEVDSAPVMGLMQFGMIAIGRTSGIVVDTTPIALGTYSYATGTVSGELTSCGEPLPAASVQASNGFGSVGADGTMGIGSYQLQLPEGDYSLRAMIFGMQFASTQQTISAASPATWSANVELGGVRGTISHDGVPSQFSPVTATEIAEGLACSASCGFWDQTFDVCFFCPAPDGRQFGCNPTMTSPQPCRYNDTRFYSGNTGVDGIYRIDNMVPGLYHVVAASGGSGPGPGGGGQSGGITVGTFDVRVAACELASINVVDATVAAGVDQTVALGDGIQLTFDDVAAGTASFRAISTPPPAQPLPTFQSAGLFYDIFVPAFTGQVEVCLPYDVDEASTDLHLYHAVGSTWVDITTSVDTTNHIVCGTTTSFSWFTVGHPDVAPPPPTLTITGPDRAVADAACRGHVTFGGGGSYTWYVDGALVGTGTTMPLDLPLGQSTITATSGSQTASATVTVVDESPPTLSLVASPAKLWPANGKLVSVSPSGQVSDNCDHAPTLTVQTVTSPTAAPTDMAVNGSTVQLRAFRDGAELAGRSYVIEYAATDAAGNRATSRATVVVPHDQRK